MVELEEHKATLASRHIIERPRLTRLLDETTARVIMLVAPAGYGKTTLARQWLAKRPHVWYAARPASADLAALGTDVIAIAEKSVPDVGSRLRSWLYAQRGLGDAVRVADLLVGDLSGWPEQMWFAIDDYQLLTPDAEHVIDRIRTIPNISLVITSRRRPVWCSSRDILYGDVFEVGAEKLKMNDAEAAAVLGSVDPAAAQDFIELAEGWPAIIGLASFADAPLTTDRDELPPELHSYIAEELFASLAPNVREKLAQLSLLSSISLIRAAQLLGDASDGVVAEGIRVGFLTDARSGALAMHPLLREFLYRKLLDLPPSSRAGLVEEVLRLLIDEREWDEAFEVVRQFDMPDALIELLEASLYELLESGHLVTISKFVAAGRSRGADESLLALADAELAFREGFHERSRRLAERASDQLAESSPLASKALALAGNSAYFGEALPAAERSFRKARELATTREDERRAVWGLFLSALEQEDDAAAALLDEFEASSGSSPDELTRIQNGRLHFGTRLGTLSYGLAGAEAVGGIVGDAKDPVVRASFWHVYAAARRAAADYAGALDASDRALREINEYDLRFGRAHVYLIRAGALMGTGAYDEALGLLDEVAREATRNADTYLQMSEQTSRCKLYLLLGHNVEAIRTTETEWSRVGSRGQLAEFLAARAVALASEGSRDLGIDLLARAEATSRENEASALCTSVRALFAVEQRESLSSILPRIREAVSRGILDPFVFAFRLNKRLPRQVARVPTIRSALQDVLNFVDAQGLDPRLGAGLQQPVEDAALTPREREVLGFLAAAHTNKEIAQRLFLSESTVKVHVRNVLRKIGARTRTEAAIYAVKTRRPEASDVPSASDPEPGSEPPA
jgi:LuxR family transcriptional regulator, maltose regulon positive regulatory protein